jgi:hypothetical protein
VSGRQLTFSYSWIESEDGAMHTVTATLDLASNGSTLDGSYTSSKCNCTLDAHLSRVGG